MAYHGNLFARMPLGNFSQKFSDSFRNIQPRFAFWRRTNKLVFKRIKIFFIFQKWPAVKFTGVYFAKTHIKNNFFYFKFIGQDLRGFTSAQQVGRIYCCNFFPA